MVIAIGRGGQEKVAEQFKNLNAGAIDISYEEATENKAADGKMENGNFGGNQNMPGGKPDSSQKNGTDNKSNQNGKSAMGENGSAPFGFGESAMGGNSNDKNRMNQDKIVLSEEDVEDIETFVPDISSVSISYTTKTTVDGGELEEETGYTVAGVKSIYAEISNLNLQVGDFLTKEEEENKEKVCILGATVAKEIFGDAVSAYDSTLYIGGRAYTVNGVLQEIGSVSSGISADDAIFVPYSIGVKYITGENISPTITVIAENLNDLETTIENIEAVLAESYPNAEFTITDAGSKMEAASASNDTLTTLLFVMAFIVFIVGGIGIMNVLFVSIKERTKEIGILKAIGCMKQDILLEFLLEACFISVLGGALGVLVSLGITPIVKMANIPVSLSIAGMLTAMVFAFVTGVTFGLYPAWKASCLVPVDALSEE